MAKQKVFTVYDSKTEAYLQPFHMLTRGQAVRAWESTANDAQTMISRHPADYTLFEIGEFDDASGKFTNLDAKISLGTALEFRKKDAGPVSLFAESEQSKG